MVQAPSGVWCVVHGPKQWFIIPPIGKAQTVKKLRQSVGRQAPGYSVDCNIERVHATTTV